mmetsp:Transcript_16287/g.22699  ORF Transcript_16287/g.22699 Transcript_16287/m.22699 type:complete len:230 (+) Transcript_16287:534-1223(+)
MLGVTLIGRINLLSSILGEEHLRPGVDEFTNGGVEAETVDLAALEGEDHLDSRTVGDVSSTDTISTRTKQIISSPITTRFLFVDTEDGTNTHITVNVTGSIKRIKCNAEFTGTSRGDNDRFFLFFGNKDTAHTRVDKGIDHHIISQNIKFLLVITSRIHLTSQTVKTGNTSTLDSSSNELTRSTNGIHKNNQVMVMTLFHNKPIQGFSIGIKHFGRHGCGLYNSVDFEL